MTVLTEGKFYGYIEVLYSCVSVNFSIFYRYLLVDFGLAEQYTATENKTMTETKTEDTELHNIKRKKFDEVKQYFIDIRRE